MITSTEIRQRKVSTLHFDANDLVKKEEQEPVQIKHSSNWLSDNFLAVVMFLVSLPIRFKQLSLPTQVIFDEVHFGKFSSYYINHSFFFDVHPPLVKLIMAFVAWISGFKGDFPEIEQPIPDDVPYIQLRAMGTLLGCFVVPLAYLTIRDAGHSRMAATLTALAICFENGLITNNRLILLDAYLLFFTAFTVFTRTRFYNKTRSFSQSWWAWLLFTGIGLGCTISSKWLGIFTVATIGISTVKDLWEVLGNLQVSKRQYAVHLFAKVTFLVVLPLAIYIGSFYAHFTILNKPGPGESFMELPTQFELKGFEPIHTPALIAYGSLITIRHKETTGAYLHSHSVNYPRGSQQQQVTLYPHRDNNNWWRILKADVFDEPKKDLLANDNTTWLEYVRNGDMIRLEHVQTAPRKLHSHDVTAPITDTDYHKEVSGYGFPEHVGDSNDFWKVQIDNNTNCPEAGQFLQARRSNFRLLHRNEDCHLFSSWERLPEWGYDQQEVACIVEGMKPKTMWEIDETYNYLLPEDTEMIPEHRPNFIEKFIHLHKRMWAINNEYTEDHTYQSRPYQWPILLSGISYLKEETSQIYLLGNPLVYWSSTAAVATLLIVFVILQLRQKRGYSDSFGGMRCFYENSAGFFLTAWALHFVPFFYMRCQLFLHHYMPALYFAVLTCGVLIDMISRKFSRVLNIAVFIAAAFCIVYTYLVYAPLAYGESWTVSECENASLLKSWDLHCGIYSPVGSADRVVFEEQQVSTEKEDVVYVDEDGNRIALEDVPAEYILEHEKLDIGDDDEEDEEIYITSSYDDDDDEEEEYYAAEPTEAPAEPEYAPEFIDGKEVYGDDDEDEDEWPRTIYGTDPEADEDEEPKPLTVRDIPHTKHLEL